MVSIATLSNLYSLGATVIAAPESSTEEWLGRFRAIHA